MAKGASSLVRASMAAFVLLASLTAGCLFDRPAGDEQDPVSGAGPASDVCDVPLVDVEAHGLVRSH